MRRHCGRWEPKLTFHADLPCVWAGCPYKTSRVGKSMQAARNPTMSARSARLSLAFSCVGHAYMHMFTAFYFVIVLALEIEWNRPYHELIGLWTLGSFLVGLGALPAGWLADRWSASGMMVVFFIGLGAAGIACGFLDTPLALLVGLAAIGLFSAIYHPVG